MADLMTLGNRLNTIADGVETNAELVKKATALAVDQALVLATPVDTGHARANWQISAFNPVTEELDDEDQVGNSTINRNEAAIKAIPPEADIYITNNVPYIGELNNGKSAQAPAMFVQRALLAGIRALAGMRIVK